MAVAVTCGEPDQTLSLGNILSLTEWRNRCQKDCGLRRICQYPDDKESRDGQNDLENIAFSGFPPVNWLLDVRRCGAARLDRTGGVSGKRGQVGVATVQAQHMKIKQTK